VPKCPAYDSTPPGNWDYLNIRDMLVPERLDGAIDLPSAGPLRVPEEPLAEDLFVCPGLVVLGADYYEGELHRELGITQFMASNHPRRSRRGANDRTELVER